MIVALDQPAGTKNKQQPVKPKLGPTPVWIALSCRTCYWRSGAGRCHRYPPTAQLPAYPNVSVFPACPQDGWCGEWKEAQ